MTEWLIIMLICNNTAVAQCNWESTRSTFETKEACEKAKANSYFNPNIYIAVACWEVRKNGKR